jgi:hypothetical protein
MDADNFHDFAFVQIAQVVKILNQNAAQGPIKPI